jgi:polyisoprenoid-binding protein YceI
MHAVRVPKLCVFITLFNLLTLAPAVFAADTYSVDNVHSSLVFKVKHLDTGYVWGRFNNLTGKAMLDESGAPTSVEFSADANSIDTGNAKRDTHLKSPDFFSAKEFQKITFKSSAIKSAGQNKFEVSGDLTLHGQTRPITVTVEKTGSSNGPQGTKVGFATTFTVKRSEYGMGGMVPQIADEVEIHLGTEMKKG